MKKVFTVAKEYTTNIKSGENHSPDFMYLPSGVVNALGGIGAVTLEFRPETCDFILRKHDENAEKRENWVKRMLRAFHEHEGQFCTKGHTNFVALKSSEWLRVGQSTPSYADDKHYDLYVGIAVATAHAMGFSIPDYI